MSHSDYLCEDRRKVRDSFLDALERGVSMREALALILVEGKIGRMEANGIISQMKEIPVAPLPLRVV